MNGRIGFAFLYGIILAVTPIFSHASKFLIFPRNSGHSTLINRKQTIIYSITYQSIFLYKNIKVNCNFMIYNAQTQCGYF